MSLALTSFWREEPIVLVRATDGIRLCGGGGYTILSAREACACFDDLDKRDMASLRAFFAWSRATSLPCALLRDHEVVRQLRDGIRNGVWVAVRKGAPERMEAQGKSTTKQRRIVRAIEQKTEGRLDYQGRHYRLVADADLARLPRRDEFEVVRQDAAAGVLAGLAGQAGASPDLAALFREAVALLAPDWRPPLFPDGLVLMHKLVVQASSRDLEASVMTPSQLEKLRNPVALDCEDRDEPEELLVLVDVQDEPDLDAEVEMEPPDASEEAAAGGAGEPEDTSEQAAPPQ
ncbi:MAG: hypothetical protein JXP73_01285 [Deltaproteobacteria bacterium]|nr:hypothetical protein [Deltaproteobacteria bacterium]